MSEDGLVFNPPPGWPIPPDGWVPPNGWTPNPDWPAAPEGWELWLPSKDAEPDIPTTNAEPEIPTANAIESDSQDEVITTPDTRIAMLEAENAALHTRLESMSDGNDLVILNDEIVLQSVGIYRYHHPLENAASYRERLEVLSGRISDCVKAGAAIEKSNMFTFDNSLAKGRKMTQDLAKLMLRAYNAEVDNCLRSLKAGNVVTAKKRIEVSRKAIAKLGAMMEMRISEAFHRMRIEEVELAADFLMKKQVEREEAREERARLREEKKVAAELAAERERLDKERSHIENALKLLREQGESDAELEGRLSALDDAIAQNDYRAANVRAGYVYVISNQGAFGANVIKIGLTRRLEPIERVNELGGASVPFRFDVHALYFSEDAVTLETELHQHFSDCRVNLANSRKEFFFVSPSEVREVLEAKVGNLLEFNERAESTEYLQSVGQWKVKPTSLAPVPVSQLSQSGGTPI
ncbi:MAG: DUF4041 domain-containing protein [Verrucomicrobiales bacterium]|nr:DUF4041 domain-containing protein [Verrucomicrobiales bacterium]